MGHAYKRVYSTSDSGVLHGAERAPCIKYKASFSHRDDAISSFFSGKTI